MSDGKPALVVVDMPNPYDHEDAEKTTSPVRADFRK